MTFGERLVQYRKRRNLTQKELAENIGITPTRLNYWEKDKRQPDVENIRILASALDVSADDLLGISENEKSPAPEGSEDSAISLDEMKVLLRRLGLIGENDDITEKDAAFVSGVFDLLEAWFDR